MLAECSSENYLSTSHQNIAATTAGLYQMALIWDKGLLKGVWRGGSQQAPVPYQTPSRGWVPAIV